MQMLLQDTYTVHLASTGKDALTIVKQQHIDLVLLDINLPEIDGIEVLKMIKNVDDSIEIIMVTAVVTVGRAVEAIRSGAYDYITKPFDIQALCEQVQKIFEKKKLQKENLSMRRLYTSSYQFEKIIGKSAQIRNIFKVIEDVAQSNSTVLITGDSGTGKELVAKAIHNRSPRKNNLFVAVNCAAIPENLLESELFGHERGSFTGALERQIGKFEISSGGTIFLDEIGSLPLPMQAKILRVLQEKEVERVGGSRPIPVDIRIISATNSDIKSEVKNKRFRDDLFYRLNVVPIHLPPLRERRGDIELLINHFMNKYNREFNKKIKGFSKEALNLFIDYDWPGNIRELENMVERLVVLNSNNVINAEQLPSEIKKNLDPALISSELKFRSAVNKFEADFIKNALEKAGGKKGVAAKILGIHRNTLINLEKKIKA